MSIKEAFKYPFNKWTRLFYFYWLLLPIIGWFWVYGYILKIIQNLILGNNKELPAFGSYSENFKKGFFFFVYMLFLAVVLLIINFIPFVGVALAVIFGLTIPIITIQYTNRESFSDGFDIKKALTLIFDNIIEYLVAIFKTIVVIAILLLLSIPIITLIVTLPALQFFQYYFFVDFYKNFAYKKPTVKKKTRKKTTRKKRR